MTDQLHTTTTLQTAPPDLFGNPASYRARLARLDEHGIPHDHPAVKKFVQSNHSFNVCVEEHAAALGVSFETALADLGGRRAETIPAPALTAAQQKALDAAAQVERQQAEAEAAHLQLVNAWNQKMARLDELQTAESEAVVQLATIESRIVELRGDVAESIRRDRIPGNHQFSTAARPYSPTLACMEAAAMEHAMPAFTGHLARLRAQIAAHIEETRAFGEANKVPKQVWPEAPAATNDPTSDPTND